MLSALCAVDNLTFSFYNSYNQCFISELFLLEKLVLITRYNNSFQWEMQTFVVYKFKANQAKHCDNMLPDWNDET